MKTQILFMMQIKKKIINCFCPNPEELNEFLEHCEIREIKDESILNEIPKENIFDPEQFLKQNYKKEEFKSYLSIEDMTLIANKTKLEYPEQLNAVEEKPYTAKPEIEDKTELINGILKNEILDVKQKEELDIVFDLDNTCIL